MPDMKQDEKNGVEGIIRVTGKGVGYFSIPATELASKPDRDEDWEIQPENLKTAMNRDRVKVEPLGQKFQTDNRHE